jgi:hypothetical protein
MGLAAWFVVPVLGAGGAASPAVAPPPREVLAVVWEWDPGHPKYRAVVTETGEAVQVLVASGRLTIDPDQAVVDQATLKFRVSEASPLIAGAFSGDTQRICPAGVGREVRVPHSVNRVSIPLVVIATEDGKPGGKPVTFRRGTMLVELLADVRLVSRTEFESLVLEPAGCRRP